MLIPKNTKIKNTIWKNYSVWDMLFAIFGLVVVFLIALSNFKGKWYGAIIFGVVIVALLIPTGNEQVLYNEIFQMFKYMFMPKKFFRGEGKNNVQKLAAATIQKTAEQTGTENTKKSSAESKPTKGKKQKRLVDELIPYTAIKPDGTIKYPGYYGKVINVGSKEFGLEDDYAQDMDILQMSQIYQCIESSQTLDFVKIDRPIIFDKYIYNVMTKLEEAGFSAEEVFDQESKKAIAEMEKLDPKKFEIDKIKQEILLTRFKQLDYLNLQEKQYRPYYYYVVYDSDLQTLRDTARKIVETCNGIELPCEILRQKDVAVFLKYCNTRKFDEREIDELRPEQYLDWIKPKKVAFSRNGYKIDDVDAFVLGIQDYPISVDNAWGAELMNIDNTKVVMHVVPVAQHSAVKRIDKVVNELFSREDALHKASEQLGQETHLETMRGLLVDLQNNNESFADVAITITGFNYDKQEYSSFRKKVRNDIVTKGFVVNPLWWLQIDGMISSNISRRGTLKTITRGIQSSVLGAVFPFVNTAVLEEKGIMLGANDYPFIFDIWKRSEYHQNSNMMVIGRSGGGKSYFLKSLIVHLYAEGCVNFILDPENEYGYMARKLGGKIVDVGNATEGRLNPFHIFQILTEDGEPAEPRIVFYSHLRTLESFLKIVLEGMGYDCLEMINNLIVELYKSKGITPDTDVKDFAAEQFPIFSDLLRLVEDRKKKEKNELLYQDFVRIESYVKKFGEGGRYSDIWNGASTLTSNGNMTVFNFQGLFASKNNVVATAQMLLVFRFLEQEIINMRERNKSQKAKHVCIIADEAHLFIDPKYPIALDFFYQMEKRIRKYDGSFIPATQSIGDWNSNEELASKTTAIIKNSQYNIILPLNPSDVEDLVAVFRSGAEINETEQHQIVNAKTGEAFFIGSTKERTSFKIVTPYEIEKFFKQDGVESNDDNDFYDDFEEVEEDTKKSKRKKKKLERKNIALAKKNSVPDYSEEIAKEFKNDLATNTEKVATPESEKVEATPESKDVATSESKDAATPESKDVATPESKDVQALSLNVEAVPANVAEAVSNNEAAEQAVEEKPTSSSETVEQAVEKKPTSSSEPVEQAIEKKPTSNSEKAEQAEIKQKKELSKFEQQILKAREQAALFNEREKSNMANQGKTNSKVGKHKKK